MVEASTLKNNKSNHTTMDETKKYRVVSEVTIDEVTHAEGDIVEITEAKATELGEAVQLMEDEAGENTGSESGSDEAAE